MSGAGAVELEVRTELVELWNVSRNELELALRIEYRPAGQRRWRRFNLIPDPGQTVAALERHANLAAQMVHAGRVPGRVELVESELVDDGGAA